MDPITIAATIAAVGKLFKGVTSFLGGNAEARQLKMAADQHRAEAGVRSNIELEQGARVAATAATRAAASGGGVTGSAVDVLADLGRQTMFNARSAIYRGRTQANADLYNADVAKKQGTIDLISSVFDAGSSFLGGVGQSRQLARMSAPTPSTPGMPVGSDVAGLY